MDKSNFLKIVGEESNELCYNFLNMFIFDIYSNTFNMSIIRSCIVWVFQENMRTICIPTVNFFLFIQIVKEFVSTSSTTDKSFM